MDQTTLLRVVEDAILTQCVHGTEKDSLIYQNHLYGCFILTEDLAYGRVRFTEDGVIRSDTFQFDVMRHFSKIGIRYYGFLSDGMALWSTFSPDYANAWRTFWNTVQEMDEVDAMEDAILRLLSTHLPKQCAFFDNALTCDGSLSVEWMDYAMSLLHEDWISENHPFLHALSDPPSSSSSASLSAEKESRPSSSKRKGRPLATTQRHLHSLSETKSTSFSLTRRAKRIEYDLRAKRMQDQPSLVKR